MADVSLSRAVADESLGKRLGRGLRTGLGAVPGVMGEAADMASPITALPNVAGNLANRATGGFFSDFARGFSPPEKGPDTPYDAGENLVATPDMVTPAPKPITNESMGLGDSIAKFLDSNKISQVPMGMDPTTQYKAVAPPDLAPPPVVQRPFNHSYGSRTEGGVFGFAANQANTAADTYNQLAARKGDQRDFSNQVVAATGNATNYDKLYDSASKRYGTRSAAEAHGLTAGIAALKNMKEVQEAELLRRRNGYLQNLEAQRAAGGNQLGFEDLATLTNAHINPDQITTLPASVGPDGKPLPPMAISSRYGSAITPSANGALVDQVHSATAMAQEGKIFTDGKQRYMIKNGQKVPF